MKSWPAVWAVLAAVVVCGCVPENELGRGEPQTDAIRADRFRYNQRVSEDGSWPENAVMRAKAQRDALLAAQSGRNAGVSIASWSWLGPGRVGGRLRSIVVHPTQPNTIWVGSVGGGIWKTEDGGLNWRPLDDFMPTLAIGCMLIDPSNPDILYAGTGEGFFESEEGSSNTAAIRGAGIFKSYDGGLTWNQLGSTAGPNWYFVNRMAVHPNDTSILWAATATGIYKSLDGGSTWTLKKAGDFLDLKLSPADATQLVANESHVGVWRSTDGGESWTASTGATGHRSELAYAPSNPSIVYAAVCDGTAAKIYRSTDGGASFVLMTSGGGIGSYEIYNVALWVDPTNAANLVVGGVNLYRSTNSGTTLTQTFTGVHADMHLILSDPGYNGTSNRILYVACDGGIYRIPDSSSNSSTRINNNLGITQFYGAAMHDGSGVLIAGAQDNGTNRYTGNTMVWNENVIGGDGAYCASDPTNSNYFYGATQFQAIRRSSNGGSSYSGIAPPGAGSNSNYNFIPYFLLDPNNANRMYACGEVLYRSNNVKTGSPPTWTSVKPSIRRSDGSGGGGDGNRVPGDHFLDNNPWNISVATVAEGNSSIMWVGHNNGNLYRTSNATASTPTWTRVDTNGVGLPDRWISSIVIDRNNTNLVYVTFMGWEPDNIWRTTDNGATWAPITGTAPFAIPETPVVWLAKHRTKAGWLYAGTDIGIFTSSDDGQTWSVQTDGPGTVPVEQLFWRNDNQLVAVTHGRGIWIATINTAEEPFAATGFSTNSIWVSGGLSQLLRSDDDYVVVRTPNERNRLYQMTMTFEGTAPVSTGSSLRFNVENRAGAIGQVVLEMFNYATGLWEAVYSGPIPTTDTLLTGVGPGSAGQYIEPGTRHVRGRIGWTETDPTGSRTYTGLVDHVTWKLTL